MPNLYDYFESNPPIYTQLQYSAWAIIKAQTGLNALNPPDTDWAIEPFAYLVQFAGMSHISGWSELDRSIVKEKRSVAMDILFRHSEIITQGTGADKYVERGMESLIPNNAGANSRCSHCGGGCCGCGY